MKVFPPAVLAAFAVIVALLGVDALVSKASSPPTPPPASGAPASVSVDFLGTAAIELTPTNDKATGTVVIRNDSAVPAAATFQMTLVDRSGQELAKATQADVLLDPLRATPVTLALKVKRAFDAELDARLPARGIVMITAAPKVEKKDPPEQKAAPAAALIVKSRELIVLQVQPSLYEARVTTGALGAAFIVLVCGFGACLKGTNAAPRDGSPAWTPQSWSTNLAIGGALLTSFVGMTALPMYTHYAAKGNYSVLSTFYTALIAAAPAIYGLLRAGGTPSQRGALFIFTAAAAVTVWATIGQLGMAGMLFLELREAHLLNAPAAKAAVYLAGGTAVLVLVHALRAVWFYATPAPAPPGGAPVPPPGGGGASSWPLL